jgi:cell division protein FtsB
MELAKEEMNIRSEIEKYREEYRESTQKLDELNADSNSIERIAREKYFMKKPNEDIFVFVSDTTAATEN